MTNDTVEIPSNQTHFAEEEPLFEESSLPVDPNAPIVPRKKKSPLALILIGAGLIVIVILFLIVIMLLMPVQMLPTKAKPSPTPTVKKDVSALEQRINELDVDLKQADPSKLDLPFPPVNMELELDKKRL